MRKKQFKAESKRLLDLMINSIYTNKEIFLRELISNASDALDKRYYHSLTQGDAMQRSEYVINLSIDEDNRLFTISDNGCGMDEKELENNLGTIAKSGSLDFKTNTEKQDDVEIIGQFGVGFYSAFMVADTVCVTTRKLGSDKAYKWTSNGADGYTIEECEKADEGTVIVLHIKDSTEDENYDEFLDSYRISGLVKKYSDYIRYPIMLDMERSQPVEGSENEFETVTEPTCLNSMVPLWRKNKNELTEDDYNGFYKQKFMDYEDPILVVHSKTEGQATYDALLFVPSHAPWDFYSKDYEKGLQLYSNGVLIMDKCADLLGDHFSFVRGLVDSADLSLNISREMLQQDRQLRIIARNIEKRIKSELVKLMNNEREKYETFFSAFGLQLKYGIYNGYGANTELLKDLLMFVSSAEKKLVTFQEYVSRMKEEQKSIYYACGETVDKIDMLPQVDAVKAKGYEILYLTDNVDEFALKMMMDYDGKQFVNVCADELDIDTEEEKQAIKEENDDAAELLECMKAALGGEVEAVRFTDKLRSYAVCLSSEGGISLDMEKTLNAMPVDNKVKARTVLEINNAHAVAGKLKGLFADGDKEAVGKYAKLLYAQARLIGGLSIDNPAEFSELVCELM